MKLEYHPEASAELEEVVRHYAGVDPDVAERFLKAFDRATRRMLTMPESYPGYQATVRKALLAGFPYKIFFCLRDETVYLVAVAHASRKPDYWADRL